MRCFWFGLTLIACSSAPKVCNGHAQLCERPFDEVAFAVSHNAMSNADDGWPLPNQTWSLGDQLQAGVRGFMLDTYEVDGKAVLCHNVCAAGSIDLVEALVVFRNFLDENPGEIITFMIQQGIDAELTASAFEESDTLRLTHAQSASDPWPTLAELAAADSRLVVFHEGSDATLPWYMPGYQGFVWDTDYAAVTPDDLSCAVLRGDPASDIYLVNHFLTAPFARPELADQVNFNPLLQDRIAQCADESGRPVSWVAVDFIDRGDVLATIDAMNAQ